MNAIKFRTTVDEATAKLLPALRPMLGQNVEVIALQTNAEMNAGAKLNIDELLALRMNAPPGSAPLTEDDIQRAIVQGALDGNS